MPLGYLWTWQVEGDGLWIFSLNNGSELGLGGQAVDRNREQSRSLEVIGPLCSYLLAWLAPQNPKALGPAYSCWHKPGLGQRLWPNLMMCLGSSLPTQRQESYDITRFLGPLGPHHAATVRVKVQSRV